MHSYAYKPTLFQPGLNIHYMPQHALSELGMLGMSNKHDVLRRVGPKQTFGAEAATSFNKLLATFLHQG